ncbi:hypothetical protein APY03_6943 [Variovorax sp. WDL1]|nr:hypothetical protein APY03_6943 [Variovorax sp. WDL1]
MRLAATFDKDCRWRGCPSHYEQTLAKLRQRLADDAGRSTSRRAPGKPPTDFDKASTKVGLVGEDSADVCRGYSSDFDKVSTKAAWP